MDLPLGGWFLFPSGPLAGRIIRVHLEEIQKADIGRRCVHPGLPRAAGTRHVRCTLISESSRVNPRYGRKDKRPLDPPPVVRIRLFQLLNPGLPYEAEQELELHEWVITKGPAH